LISLLSAEIKSRKKAQRKIKNQKEKRPSLQKDEALFLKTMNKKTKLSTFRIAKSEKNVNGFTSINNFILRDSKLTDKEFRILIVLISWYNKKMGFSYPSAVRQRKEAHVCERARKQILNSLIRKKQIKRKFRSGSTCAYTFSCYPFPEDNKKKPALKKKKAYFWDNEMRSKNQKWYVIEKDGEWKEFAGKESEIEWR